MVPAEKFPGRDSAFFCSMAMCTAALWHDLCSAGASIPMALAAQRSEALEQFDLPVSQLGRYEKIDQVRCSCSGDGCELLA